MQIDAADCVKVDGSSMLHLILSMIFISIIYLLALIVQMKCALRRAAASQIKCDPLPTNSKVMPPDDSLDVGRTPCMDQALFFSGNDFPFHLVKELSSEMSMATRNYLRKLDEKNLQSSWTLDEIITPNKI
jgi:hypothetical protein